MVQLPSLEIPAIKELAEYCQFVCWRRVTRDGKETKIPINPRTGLTASVTDPSSWATFEDAWHRCVEVEDCDGIGFVFTENDPYSGIDLDKCLDQNGQPTNGADNFLNELVSYTEISPSGQGLHIIGRGCLPVSGLRKDGHFEAYSNKRYFTLTGLIFDDAPSCLKELDIDWIVARADKPKTKKEAEGLPELAKLTEQLKPIIVDEGPVPRELIECAMVMSEQLTEVWERHDQEAFPSASEWDLALANHLLVMRFEVEHAAAGMMAYRCYRGEDVKPRADYYARTIIKAYDNPYLTGRAASTDEETTDMDGARHVLYKLTNWPVRWFNKYGDDSPLYGIEMADGREMECTLRALDTPLAFHRLMLQFNDGPDDPVCPKLGEKIFTQVKTALFKCIRKRDIGEEAGSEIGYVRDQIRRFLRLKPKPLEVGNYTSQEIDSGHPIIWQDKTWFSIQEFKEVLRRTFGERIETIKLNKIMTRAGSRGHTIAVKEPDGKRTTRKVWMVPDDLMEE